MDIRSTEALKRHYNKLLSSIHSIKSYQSASLRIADLNLICIYQLETGVANASLQIANIGSVDSFNQWMNEHLKDLIIEANLVNAVIASINRDDPQPITFEGGKR